MRTALARTVFLLSALLLFGFSTVEAQTVLPDPGTIKQMGSFAPGTTLLFNVTGKTSGGSVWGTDFYTTDSNLAMVAVHAGASETGRLESSRLPSIPADLNMPAAPRHGVTSDSWGSYELSFAVEADAGVPVPEGNAGAAQSRHAQ